MLLCASACRACSLLRYTGTCHAHVAPPALSVSPSRAFAPAATRDVSARAQETGTTMLTPGCDLTKASCQGKCDKYTPLVTQEDLRWLLPCVPRWQLAPDGKALHRKFTARNFGAAVDFFSKLVAVAEAEGHHPDLHLTNYRDVEVVISTHAAGGLTQFDFVLAAKLDTVPIDYSPKWLRENPEPGAAPSTTQ